MMNQVCRWHFIEDLSESTPEIVEARTKSYYTRFHRPEVLAFLSP